MELTKLFETQKILRDRIGYDEPDRFNKLVLALLVELGECANEWRGFKFWSKNQEPRTKVSTGSCIYCAGTGNVFYDDEDEEWEWCEHCEDGETFKNPLLEEYVDGLHFVLELMIETEFELGGWLFEAWKKETIELQFIEIKREILNIQEREDDFLIPDLISLFIGLGEMLGFTWEEVEKAYFAKNKINHDRQNNGY